LLLILGVFSSYLLRSKFPILGLVQHQRRIDMGNDFKKDFRAIGGGLKDQLTTVLNIETLYTNFIRGNNTGLGETFNIGLRVLF
tara:strand:+ start:324 stop:575 length:252 start_codon:yes stop_codon:yes gene_type:complete